MDKEIKMKWYQALLNGWTVTQNKEFIDELENFCMSQEWEYKRSEFQIKLIR